MFDHDWPVKRVADLFQCASGTVRRWAARYRTGDKTVTVAHVAGVPVRNAQTVSFSRHCGVTALTCQPADPASKGGEEASVKLARADLVPTGANLRGAYGSFAELEAGVC